MKTDSLANPVAAPAPMSRTFFARTRDGRGVLPARWFAITGARVSAILIPLLLLTACSDDSKPAATEKPEVKGPELISARSAFQKLYVAARSWNPDAKPYRLESAVTTDG